MKFSAALLVLLWAGQAVAHPHVHHPRTPPIAKPAPPVVPPPIPPHQSYAADRNAPGFAPR